MADYTRKTFKFIDGGVQTNRPVNLVDDSKYPYLKNVTKLITGALASRYGYTVYNKPGTAAINSIKRANDIQSAPSQFGRFVGDTSGALYLNGAALDTGYSGNPLAIVPYRPLQSPRTWVYINDINQFKKYTVDGAYKYQTGIFPPNKAPVTALAAPIYADIDTFLSTSGWNPTGISGPANLGTRVPAGTTILNILYDTGTTGWACVSFTNAINSYAFLGQGARLVFNAETAATEYVSVQLTSTTVASILYDSGSTGICSIQMNTPVQGLIRDQFLNIGSEQVRVLGVIQGPDGLYSFRCSTTGTHVVGEAITSDPSARVYFTGTHSSGENVTAADVQFVCTVASGTSSGVGTIDKTISENLATAGGRPLGSQDYIHISVRADNPANITELRFYLDVDAVINDFAHTAYYASFRSNDFTQSATGTLSSVVTAQTALTYQQLYSSLVANNITSQGYVPESVYEAIAQGAAESLQSQQYSQGVLPPGASAGGQPASILLPSGYSDPYSIEANIGTQAWTEFLIPVSSMTFIGGDVTRSLANVAALRIWANVMATTTIEVSSWWLGGGYGPNVAPASNGIGFQTGFFPYLYRYVYRSSLTGAVSAPSPPEYTGSVPRRGGVYVRPTISSDPQVDKIDIERYGGSVTDTFHYLGTINNTVGTYYLDTLIDAAVNATVTFPEDAYIPFPVDDLPHTGIVNTSGTAVQWVSGDQFNTSWVRGTQIIINGTAYTLNAPPLNATQLFTVENIGALTSASLYIPDATIMGRNLPVMSGPLRDRLFGCGDYNNPGLCYFTFQDNPDCASDTGWVEITSPSEPLMNGCIYQGSSIVFSTERAFRLQPSYGDNPNVFTPEALASGRGLYARYGLCSGPKIWFVGRDGIYEYAADGGAISITDTDLYNLFPHDSQPGLNVTVNGHTLYAPNYAVPNNLRLSYCNNWLYFDYQGLDGNQHTLAYHTLARSWWPYEYTPGATYHYTEEGQNINSTMIGFIDGTVGFMGGYGDGANTISSLALTGSMDLGDTRADKQFGDCTIDADSEAVLTFSFGFDNDTTSVSPQPATQAIGSRSYLIYDLASGLGELYRNISLSASWATGSSNTSPVILYEWQPSWLVKPEFSQLRATDWYYPSPGYHWFQGIRITCDTQGIPFTFEIQKDGAVDTTIRITVTANGETVVPFSWVPFESHGARILPLTTPGEWRVMNIEWISQPCPEHGTTWITQPLTHGLAGWQHLGEIYPQYCTNYPAVLTIVTDNAFTITINLPSTGGIPLKPRIRIPVLKGKTFVYSLIGNYDLQFYYIESEVRVKQWGENSPFKPVHPFGDVTQGYFSIPGARI